MTLRIRPIRDSAAYIIINDKNKPHKITIDHKQMGEIPGVIHELLHLVLHDDLHPRFNRELEERIVINFERLFTERVLNDTVETEWWRGAIERKLKQ